MGALLAGRRSMRAALVFATAAVLSSCQTPDDITPESPVATCDGTMATGPQMITDPALYAFMSDFRLRSDAQIASGGSTISTYSPHHVALSLDLCLSGSPGLDGLISVATEIAHALKQHDLGSRTSALSIAYVGPNLSSRLEVRDANFHLHPWNGTPSPAEEARFWEVVPTTPN
ncbi:hypothetical protein [Nocardia sp. XZ_19_385]|uniref:hypothetical protein n=1 Tax=Nocardia sp. XZ_19_385 TaxID=2769488 RepID=UPI00188F1663|nr:hypothetical protein [Nocardia sp. XZ_19_385]